jgi:hypothetical protein
MDRYMDRYGGCFHPDGRVLLLNGTSKRVKNLRQGDILSNGAVVRCNVQLSINAPLPMCRLQGGLLITPWHPVCLPRGSVDSWCFPADVSAAELVFVKNVYNLVLDSQHSVIVDGVSCTTLGHGNTEDRVLAHAFFGTTAGNLSSHRLSPLCSLRLAFFPFFTLSAVLDFLSQLPGWHAGLVRCSGVALRGSDGRVCGFEQDGESVWEEEEDADIEVDASEVRANPQFPVMVN